jgi:hypothetical protein
MVTQTLALQTRWNPPAESTLLHQLAPIDGPEIQKILSRLLGMEREQEYSDFHSLLSLHENEPYRFMPHAHSLSPPVLEERRVMRDPLKEG